MMDGKKIGVVAFLIIAVAVLGFSLFSGGGSEKSDGGITDAVQKAMGNGPVVTVHGPVGGEKMGLLADEEILSTYLKSFSRPTLPNKTLTKAKTIICRLALSSALRIFSTCPANGSPL